MPVTKKIKVNGEALKAEVLKGWKTLGEASNMIGCSDSYLGNIVRRNEIPRTKPAIIESVLGISPEKYIVPEQTEFEIEPESDGAGCFDIDEITTELKKIRQALECICIKNGVWPEWVDTSKYTKW